MTTRVRFGLPPVLRLIAILILCSAGFIVVAKSIGVVKLSHADELLHMISTNADGSPCQTPCLFGLQPNVTKFDDTLLMLGSHPSIHVLSAISQNTANGFPYLQILLADEMKLYINGDKDSGIVTGISLVWQAPTFPITLGDAIATFDAPSKIGNYVNRSMKTYLTTAFYPAEQMAVYCDLAPNRAIKLTTPVTSVYVGLYALMVSASSWQGFVKYPEIAIGP